MVKSGLRTLILAAMVLCIAIALSVGGSPALASTGVTISSASTVPHGHGASFSGEAALSKVGQMVWLQVYHGDTKTWHTVSSATMNNQSQYHMGFTKRSSGGLLFRALLKDGSHSKNIRVTWT